MRKKMKIGKKRDARRRERERVRVCERERGREKTFKIEKNEKMKNRKIERC